MNLFYKILWLALTCYVSVQGQGIQIDAVRSEYIALEENSWSVIENGIDHAQSLKQIMKNYREFIEDQLTSAQSVNDFITFDKIYEWKLLQQNLITLNNLFEAYRLMLSQYVEEFDNLALNDFAETVLFDKDWPVNQTLDQIENIMVKQGLYYKATLVSNELLREAHIHFTKSTKEKSIESNSVTMFFYSFIGSVLSSMLNSAIRTASALSALLSYLDN